MKKQKTTIGLPDSIVIDKIHIIRGQKVMIDKDLAELYGVTTGNLNKSVTRHLKRFPSDFMFQLTNEEFKILMFQNGISKWGGTRKLPFVFTEQGVAMLSGILNSDRAIAVNIQIMRVFTRIRQTLADTAELRLEIEKMKHDLKNQNQNIEVVFSYLDELLKKKAEIKPREQIGFKIS